MTRVWVLALLAAGCGRIDFDPRPDNLARCGFAEIAGGGAHTCARRTDGTIACWGDNARGQIVWPPSAPVTVPTELAMPGPVAELALGAYFSCARLVDGSVVCWGGNDYGQLGDPSAATIMGLREVLPAGDVIEIAAGTWHACARHADGTVTCWGANPEGQLGRGTSSTAEAPGLVASVTTATALAVGHQHSCALLADGSAACWGRNSNGQIGDGTIRVDRPTPIVVPSLANVIAIGNGGNHTCAVRGDQTITCWGLNEDGEYGTGDTTRDLTPMRTSLAGPARDVFATARTTCALLADRSVACWGAGWSGAIGNGTLLATEPTPVAVALNGAVISASAGHQHMCVVLANGTPRCWGDNRVGQLGDGTRTIVDHPVDITLASASAIDVADNHGCAVTPTSIECWGDNNSGRLGDGTLDGRDRPVAVTLASPTAVATGAFHTCALDGAGAVWCWGRDDSGQGDLPTGSSGLMPTPSQAIASGASMLAAGYLHTCAVVGTTVQCWGANVVGELGNGTVGGSGPVTALSGVSVRKLALGHEISCALLDDGSLRCWGLNNAGQLGDGTTTNRPAPVMAAMSKWPLVSVDVAYDHACAVAMDGTTWCWGRNSRDALGSVGSNSSTPVLVQGLPAAREVTVGRYHSCVIDTTGAVWCWGDNMLGQLGDSTTWPGRATPAIVAGLPPSVAIQSREYTTCALGADGAVRCWGRNDRGQCGTGVRTHASPIAARCSGP